MPAWLALVLIGLMLAAIGGFFLLMFSQMAAKREHAGRPAQPGRSGAGPGKSRSTKARKRRSR